MKKGILKQIIILSSIFLISISLVSCTNPLKYDVLFQNDDALYLTKTVTAGSIIPNVQSPVKEGHEFLGWTLNGELITGLEKINKNTTLYAKWQIKRYTYQFLDDDGRVIKKEEGDYYSSIDAPDNPFKDGYTFIGWDRPMTFLTEDLIFNALYRVNPKEYTYQFIDFDGSILKEESTNEGATIIAPNIPKRKGYIFDGWDKEFNILEEDIIINASYIEAVLKDKIVSFLGDSITTFYSENSSVNSYYNGTNQYYYPIYSASVKTVDSTWWYKTANHFEMEIGINESLSGSDLVNSASKANRLNNLGLGGVPTIIIIHIGTNDLVNGHSMQKFESAYRSTINYLRLTYPKATIFCSTLGYSAYTGYNYTEAMRVEFNKIINEVCLDYALPLIDIASIQTSTTYINLLGDMLHPSAEGMSAYADCAINAIKKYFGLE